LWLLTVELADGVQFVADELAPFAVGVAVPEDPRGESAAGAAGIAGISAFPPLAADRY
jgi:hypothetical protein